MTEERNLRRVRQGVVVSDANDKTIVVAEQNMGQLAGYLRMKVEGIHLHQFNQVKGQPFVVKELVEAFSQLF